MKYLLALALAFTSASVVAKIYKWVDEDGKVHFGDANSRPSDQNSEAVDLKVNTYTSTSYEEAASVSDTVVIYSAVWCGYCKKAKKYFAENNIAYTEYDIEKDSAAKRRHKEMGAKGVPVILYKGKRMNGFSEAGFKRIYKS